MAHIFSYHFWYILERLAGGELVFLLLFAILIAIVVYFRAIWYFCDHVGICFHFGLLYQE
jgi:hypothetical protein